MEYLTGSIFIEGTSYHATNQSEIQVILYILMF